MSAADRAVIANVCMDWICFGLEPEHMGQCLPGRQVGGGWVSASGKMLVGAIEGGGTKFICAIGTSPGEVLDRRIIPTRDPATTLAGCVDFFREASRGRGAIGALGIACFGPLQLRRDAADYGCLLGTPKQGWSGADVVTPFVREFAIPVTLDTDVGAAARGELALGAGRGRGSLAYVTVGTGIGGAVAPAMQGPQLMHAEMGHLVVRRDPRDAGFAGICPFHADCLEGLASGPAIRARWGVDLMMLPHGHPGRSLIAGYIAQLVVAIALLQSPEVIVLGGGVMNDGALLPEVRSIAHALLADYLPALRDAGAMTRFVLSPALAGESAVAGAILMALDSLNAKEKSP